MASLFRVMSSTFLLRGSSANRPLHSFAVFYSDPRADERGDRCITVKAADPEDAKSRFLALVGNSYVVTRVS